MIYIRPSFKHKATVSPELAGTLATSNVLFIVYTFPYGAGKIG
nr:MAG TPA: hypothetical protein [Caudoviricetes sp.]